jgi:hypothetical protein
LPVFRFGGKSVDEVKGIADGGSFDAVQAIRTMARGMVVLVAYAESLEVQMAGLESRLQALEGPAVAESLQDAARSEAAAPLPKRRVVRAG